jgi:hypothetical protein
MIDLLRSNIRLVAFVVIAVVLLVVNIMFLMQWQSVKDDKATLETERRTAEANLQVNRAQYDLDELRAEEAELSRRPEFPSAFPIVDLSLFLANGAYTFQITIDKVEPPVGPPVQIGTKTIRGKDYPAYETKMTIRGNPTNVISFIKYIEGGTFTSLEVQDLSCTSKGAVWQAEFTVVVISQR